MKIEVKLKDILAERNMTMTTLSEETGIRIAAISEFANNLRTSYNKEHMVKIAKYLKLQSISELIEFVD